jgi:hypothetical protein
MSGADRLARWAAGRRRVGLAVSVAVLLLAGCTTPPEQAPAAYRQLPELSTTGAVADVCRSAQPAPRVLLLAMEVNPDLVTGLRYFMRDWGARLGCFSGRVVTPDGDLDAVRDTGYAVLVVDVSHDVMVTPEAAAAITAAAERGKPVALFAQPGLIGDHSPYPAAIAPLTSVFPGLRFTRPTSPNPLQICNGMTVAALNSPFELRGTNLFYESPFHGVFTVALGPPATALATSMACNRGAPTIIRHDDRVVAGFTLGYEVSLADNNRQAVTTKEIFVNIVHELAQDTR